MELKTVEHMLHNRSLYSLHNIPIDKWHRLIGHRLFGTRLEKHFIPYDKRVIFTRHKNSTNFIQITWCLFLTDFDKYL